MPRAAGVEIVTGDTKVVQQGGADKIFINTSGIGIIEFRCGSLLLARSLAIR